MRLSVAQRDVPLSQPFTTATGTLRACELVLVRLEAADGSLGWGEATCLEAASGQVLNALEAYAGILERADADKVRHAELLAACAEIDRLAPALSALDLALWDLAGRRAGRPVWQLLGATSAIDVEVNATIAAPDRAGAAAAAAAAARAGFRALKLKVGLGDDAGRLAAVRAAAGPELTIRLDANGAWSVPEAQAALNSLAPAGIELCEEPVHGLHAINALAPTAPVGLALDETAAEPGALSRRACTAICLKLSRCGGISATLEAAHRARLCGYEVYLASLLDGPLGIAAALHAATAIRPDRPSGLATLGLFAGREDPLPARAGVIAAPDTPGLGEHLLAWYG